jgi:hypothetical protein
MTEGSRRFPPPWRADGTPHGYVVRDANGQELVYIYSRENEDEARQAKVLTKESLCVLLNPCPRRAPVFELLPSAGSTSAQKRLAPPTESISPHPISAGRRSDHR